MPVSLELQSPWQTTQREEVAGSWAREGGRGDGECYECGSDEAPRYASIVIVTCLLFSLHQSLHIFSFHLYSSFPSLFPPSLRHLYMKDARHFVASLRVDKRDRMSARVEMEGGIEGGRER